MLIRRQTSPSHRSETSILYFLPCSVLTVQPCIRQKKWSQAPPLTSHGFCYCLYSQVFHRWYGTTTAFYVAGSRQLAFKAHQTKSGFSLLLQFTTLIQELKGALWGKLVLLEGKRRKGKAWQRTEHLYKDDIWFSWSGLESKALCMVWTVCAALLFPWLSTSSGSLAVYGEVNSTAGHGAGCCPWVSDRIGSRSWIFHISKGKVCW